MQRWPATILQTSNGRYVCLCSWPTCRHGRCGYLTETTNKSRIKCNLKTIQSINQSIDNRMNRKFHQSINQSIRISVDWKVVQSINQAKDPSIRRCGSATYRRRILYLSWKYFATVHSTVWPFSSCRGNLKNQQNYCTFFFQKKKQKRETAVKGRSLRLMLGGTASDVADAVFAFHLTTMGNLNLQTLDLFGEFDALRVDQRPFLLVHVAHVQDLAHKLNHRLGLVERRGRHCRAHRHTHKSEHLNRVAHRGTLLRYPAKFEPNFLHILHTLHRKTYRQCSASFSTATDGHSGGNQTTLPGRPRGDDSSRRGRRRMNGPRACTCVGWTRAKEKGKVVSMRHIDPFSCGRPSFVPLFPFFLPFPFHSVAFHFIYLLTSCSANVAWRRRARAGTLAAWVEPPPALPSGRTGSLWPSILLQRGTRGPFPHLGASLPILSAKTTQKMIKTPKKPAKAPKKPATAPKNAIEVLVFLDIFMFFFNEKLEFVKKNTPDLIFFH